MAIRSGRFRYKENAATKKSIIVAAKKAGGAFYRILNSSDELFKVFVSKQGGGDADLGSVNKENSLDVYVPAGQTVKIENTANKTAEGIYEFLADGNSVTRAPDTVRSGRFKGDASVNGITVSNLDAGQGNSSKAAALYRFLNSGVKEFTVHFSGLEEKLKIKESIDIAVAQGTVVVKSDDPVEGIYDFLSGED